mgnify:CR=1 FL=1
MSKEDIINIKGVIQFLIDTEEYGDDWREHIRFLQNLLKNKVKDE